MVKIKIDIPETCRDCPIAGDIRSGADENRYCLINKIIVSPETRDERCPLIEVDE